ncbi:hypothetical protein [Streptomyces sp. RKAG293]|uniref:hypothetical protein n=1 Tax=Streptomyces sp. RKAG293 TaxID=2893403 RepID=UPI002034427D|nr:hypothetical protein [Streptomyces sp. RKAG293]MCM2420294.1 hypothetical protein [Streptomyces sp. RKAG293]
MGKKNPTESATPKAPAAGSRPSVRIDAAMSDDLSVIMSAGGTASDALRAAVAILADMYRTAWAHGVCAEGSAPRLLAYQLESQQPPAPAPSSGYDAVSDTGGRSRPVARRLPAPPVGQLLRP